MSGNYEIMVTFSSWGLSWAISCNNPPIWLYCICEEWYIYCRNNFLKIESQLPNLQPRTAVHLLAVVNKELGGPPVAPLLLSELLHPVVDSIGCLSLHVQLGKLQCVQKIFPDFLKCNFLVRLGHSLYVAFATTQHIREIMVCKKVTKSEPRFSN